MVGLIGWKEEQIFVRNSSKIEAQSTGISTKGHWEISSLFFAWKAERVVQTLEVRRDGFYTPSNTIKWG